MPDEPAIPQQTGVERTTDGTIVEPSTTTTTPPPSTTTTPPPTTAEAPAEGETLLSQSKEEAKADDKKEPPKAPDKYSDYKVPEGYTLDPEVKTKADGIFKDLGLTQDSAQKLVDFYIAETKEAFEAPFKAYSDMKEKWREEAMNHPDLKGKLAKGGDVQTRISRALSQMNDSALEAEFRQMMDLTAAGNHPAFIRVLYNLAKQVTEGSHVAGKGPSTAGQSEPGKDAPPSAAQALYPHLSSR
jgi:antitoxin component of RelBE/YafQ-DinJ toxin-antitoxin module